jgi:hypothetical protein
MCVFRNGLRHRANGQSERRPNIGWRERVRERAVLTFRGVGTAALSVVVLALIVSAAYADGMFVGGCIGQQGALNCVGRWGDATDPYIRKVPEPADDAERQRSAERDRKWEARCHPQIAQDRFGVPRYLYSARGCEFGIIE